MSLLKSIILGIIQGLCEFLPISSSGHLALAQHFFGFGGEVDELAFSVLLHLGTLFAVVIIYYKDIWELIKSFFSLIGKLFKGNFKFSEYTVGERFVVLFIIAVLPLVPASFLNNALEVLMGYPIAIGVILLFNSVVLWFSDSFAKGHKDIEDTKPKNALVIGLCQLLAVLPGLSRSGSTITGGLTQGLDRTVAVKFSFLLSIPAILGACVLELPDFVKNIPDTKTMLIYLAGAVTAMIVGILAIKIVNWISKKSNFRMFSYYCFAVGVLAIIAGILEIKGII